MGIIEYFVRLIVDNSTILGYVVAHGTTVLFPRRQDGGVSAVDAERQRPTVVILGATSEEPPPGLGPIAESTSFRFAADAQELEGAIGGGDELLNVVDKERGYASSG